jgi:hypothetical protein
MYMLDAVPLLQHIQVTGLSSDSIHSAFSMLGCSQWLTCGILRSAQFVLLNLEGEEVEELVVTLEEQLQADFDDSLQSSLPYEWVVK